MAVAVPVLECPAGGEHDLDPLNWLGVRWDRFVATEAPGTTATFSWKPDENPEGTASSTWIDPAYLVSNDFTQAQMAHADAAWKVNTLTGCAVTGSPALDKRVTAVTAQVSAMATWLSSPGYPGDAKVRVVLAVDGVRKLMLHELQAAEYVGGGAGQAWSTAVSIFDLLTEVLGEGFTTGELIDAADAGRIVWQIVAWQGGDSFVEQWYCGGIVVGVEHIDTEPGVQTHTQVRVASDGIVTDILYDTGQVYDETGRRRRHWIPAEALAPADGAPHNRYVQVRRWEDGVASDWCDPVHVHFMSVGAARLLHGLDGPPIFLVEVEALLWIGGHRWLRHVTGSAYLYDATLERDEIGVANVFLRDVEIDGERQFISLEDTRSDTESIPGSAYWDELGTVIAGDGSMGVPPPPNTLYLHLADHVPPAGNRAAGVGVVLVLPWATTEIQSGPRLSVPYWPVLAGAPGTVDTLFDFREGRKQTPSGSLSIRNVDIDGGADALGIDTPWYRLFQITRPDGPSKLLVQNRPYLMLMTGENLPYEHALRLNAGTVSWPTDRFISRQTVELETHGMEWDAATRKLCTERFTIAEYPYLKEGVDSTLKGRMWGAGHSGVLAQLVDVGAAGTRKPKLYTRENCSAVPALYKDGLPADVALYPWSFDATTKLIEFNTTDTARIDEIKAAAWTMDADGELLIPWDLGSPTATTRAGALFKQWIVRIGWIPDYEAFDLLDEAEAYPVRIDCLDENLTILEALRTLEESRGVYLLPMGDRRVTAFAREATDLDAYSAVLTEEDLVEAEPTWSPDVTRVGVSPVIEYNGYPSPGTALAQVTYRDDEVVPQFGAGESTTIPTYHATEAGARARLAGVRSGSPGATGEIVCKLRAYAIRPGSRIVLDLPNALDETGANLAWRLLLVTARKRDGERVTLSVRRLDHTLTAEERPGAA